MTNIKLGNEQYRYGVLVGLVLADDPRRVDLAQFAHKPGLMPCTRLEITFKGREPQDIDAKGKVRI